MATIIGKSSGHLVQRMWRSEFFVLLLIVAMLFVIFVYAKLAPSFEASGSLLFVIVTVVVLFLAIKFLKSKTESFSSESDKYWSGHVGENDAEKVLKKLPNAYTVFRDVMIGEKKGNIDYVVVGPNGVFMVEVKNHVGKIGFNGNELTRNGRPIPEKNLLKQAVGQALAVRGYLQRETGASPYVTAILLFTNPSVNLGLGTAPVDHVFVTTSGLVRHLIESTSGSLNQSQIDGINAAMRKTVRE